MASSMLRVAMISVHTCPLAPLGSRETGGMNVYIRELSRHLGSMGVAVDVFTRRQDPEVSEIVEFAPNARVVHVAAGPTRPMDKYRVLDHLPEFVQNVLRFEERTGQRYQLVHSHYWLSNPVARDLASNWGTPLVAMFHTLGKVKNHVSRDGHEVEHSARMEIELETMESADMVVAASPTDMEHMVSYYDALPSRIVVIPEGVDTSIFHTYPVPVARTLVGMGPEKQLLFVGRIQRLKGIDLLLRSFSILLAGWTGIPKPRLTVVGGANGTGVSDPEAEERRRLEDLAQELGVAEHVQFQNAVPHERLPYFYSAADVVVVPSTYETFGLVALEAMACGAPVVASRVGGLQWTVRDGKTGILVRRRSPDLFATALREILSDDSLRARMAEEAVRAAGEFSWDVVAERILMLYRSLIPCPTAQLVPCGS